ncbi:hypothetical protein COCOR_07759 [Corallococcus coralloides DSM 2259]|uniref:DUF3592 domain-containing protein n=1 Tax=Corallococcus coralloides (strain ATCC 25202 / DSM 2259 / NBRC 100086 / M2) TaxID=1144275 RepID=H8MTB2_CORCM|nr:DUF3592 domain-containing protein [Corallococcus coralloides]AFE07725.1 hypothetical protein COCOR_07759 [Corallococcus coralloides DSM 2259]
MALFAARVLGATFVVLGASLLVMTWGSYRRDMGILAEGLHAEGTVVKKEFLAASDDSDYILAYAFTPQGGERQEHRRHVSSELWKRLRPGDRIQVQYSQGDPRRSFPEGHGVMSLGLALFLSFVEVCLFLMGLVALLGRAVPESPQVASASPTPSS